MKVTRAVTLLAHPITVGAASLGILLFARNKSGLATRFAGMPLAVLASKVVKRQFPKQKPRFWSLTPRQSMPSGHSVAVAAFAGALVDAAERRWRWLPLAIGAVGFVNGARVVAREHRVREVLVGDALGIAGAAVAAMVARRLGH